ncbi:TrkH family potassium uptake protein [Nodosilinea sp. E11]|uniref:TrkH family potassium uptake protein n=1 Tax=Nodosilinea sp. E11 TaxID=3037479 RepID=UPI002934BA7A|nr:TrkH family potassium uptake protein [Nodosilinea sp. E11]WOD38440.1 TrkH family potassium uptake protein [Nodosilinea sp. E11]
MGPYRTIRLILHDFGLLLHVPGIMALLSIPICLYFGEYYAIAPFLTTAIAAFALAQGFYRANSPKVDKTRHYHAMLIVALTWGVIPLLGAIPFVGIAALAASADTSPTLLAFQNIWNALFEAFSGFTGTGLTMATDASLLPHSLQWWRSFTEWVDGIGVIVLMLALLTIESSQTKSLETDPSQLYAAVGRQRTIGDTVRATAKNILWIYSFYTGLSILLLALLGMPLWEAINHGLTGIATGGFSITTASFTSYSSTLQLATIFIMITGAVSFPVHYQLLRRQRWTSLWQRNQHRLLLLLLGLGPCLLLLENRWATASIPWLDSLFQWSSAVTTCGFNTAQVQNWSMGAKLLLSAAMVMGGAAGSTAGGLKLHRIVLLLLGIRWHFQQLFITADDNISYRIDDEALPASQAHEQVQSAAVLASLWLLLLGIGIVVLTHLVSPIYTLEDVIFEAASATSNVGLSTGISDPTLHWGGKLMLILLMWAGRLEIIPVLLLGIAICRPITQTLPEQPSK